jgi:hypothetical protein
MTRLIPLAPAVLKKDADEVSVKEEKVVSEEEEARAGKSLSKT